MKLTAPDTGREHPEPADPLWAPFELDLHRILSCTAFRRLQNKTQVFAPNMHDHFRNRLTHSLEVAQIARCVARLRKADPDLCEAIALAHDVGHAPFSHAGEKALDELMAGRGGFNHNAHSIRVVEYLEHPYPQFRGLNLTRATLAGLMAHVTQFDKPGNPSTVSAEAQIVSIADRIAYDLHDLEDALGAALFSQHELSRIALWQKAYATVAMESRNTNILAIRRPVIDAILNELLPDLTTIPALGPSNESGLRELESLLLEKVYHHPDVARADAEGRQKIHELFSSYTKDPYLLPDRFVDRIADQGPHRVICDYIAGMTDSYCAAQHARHCMPCV